MDSEPRDPELSKATTPKATGPLEVLTPTTIPAIVAPEVPTAPGTDLFTRFVEQIVFVTAVIGAVVLGLGFGAYLSEHRHVAAYLLAYVAFRFADVLVGEKPHHLVSMAAFRERVLDELPVLILFAAAPFERTYLWGGEPPAWMSALGLLLELLGLWVALGSRVQLHFFSADRSGRERMELVKTGFYKYVRHPVYAGILLVLFAWPLVYGAGIVAIFTVLIGGFVAYRQINADEKVLLARFGEEFEEYRRTSDALIPSIW